MIRRLLQIRDGESADPAAFRYLFLVTPALSSQKRPAIRCSRSSSARAVAYVDGFAVMVAAVGLYLCVGWRAGLQSVIVGTLLISRGDGHFCSSLI
jgi:hypothetical protein